MKKFIKFMIILVMLIIVGLFMYGFVSESKIDGNKIPNFTKESINKITDLGRNTYTKLVK